MKTIDLKQESERIGLIRLGRRQGNTTRQANHAIELLLNGAMVRLTDHAGKQSSLYLETILKIRLKNEHNVKVDFYEDKDGYSIAVIRKPIKDNQDLLDEIVKGWHDAFEKAEAKILFGNPGKHPHRCPVCYGKGFLPNGYYHQSDKFLTTNTSPETCKACGGSGIIWG